MGYFGTLGLAHGLQNVIEAAEQLRKLPVAFLFIGDGAARSTLTEEVERRQLDNVVFVNSQPKRELIRYWTLCDVALVHLRDDPLFSTVLPSKIFEAMCLGKPILFAGPPGEASRLIARQRAGLTIPAAQPDGLANAIESLFRDQALRSKFAEASAAAAEHFTRAKQAELTLGNPAPRDVTEYGSPCSVEQFKVDLLEPRNHLLDGEIRRPLRTCNPRGSADVVVFERLADGAGQFGRTRRRRQQSFAR